MNSIQVGLELEIQPKCYALGDKRACSEGPLLPECKDCDPDLPFFCTEFCDFRIRPTCETDGLTNCESCYDFQKNSYKNLKCASCRKFPFCELNRSCSSCPDQDLVFCIYFRDSCSIDQICDYCVNHIDEIVDCDGCVSELFPSILHKLRKRYKCEVNNQDNYSIRKDIIYVVTDESMPGLEVVTKPMPPEELIQFHQSLVKELQREFFISPKYGCGGHLTASLVGRPFSFVETQRIAKLTRQLLPFLVRNSCEFPDTINREYWYRAFPNLDRIEEIKFQAMRIKWDRALIEFRYPDATTNSEIFKRSVDLVKKIIQIGTSRTCIPRPALPIHKIKSLYETLLFTGELSYLDEKQYALIEEQFNNLVKRL